MAVEILGAFLSRPAGDAADLPADGDDRRVTRVRMVRGSHGVGYVYDPEGTDELPHGHEQPPRPLEFAKR